MDKVEKLVEKTARESSEKIRGGFFGHVFNFDDDTKNQLFNVLQYSLLSIIPIVVLNKFVHRFIPEADDTKSNVELLAEIVAQVSLLFVGMFFIHRVITYIPTYSKVCYESLNLVNIVLGFLVIVLSLQTKLGEKVMIITDRVGVMLGGQPAQEQKQQQQQQGGNVKVTQPISVNQQVPQHQPSQADVMGQQNQMMPQQEPVQQAPDFNSMHENGGMDGGMMEPMAANGALGGNW